MSKPQIKFWWKDLENKQKIKSGKKRWLLLIDAAVTLIIVLVIVILLRHTPSDYTPEPSFERQVSPYLTHQLLPQFYNGLQRREPFDLIVDQKGLNEAIAAMGWPQIYNGLIISTPVVYFAPKNLRLMAMVNMNSVDTVVTVEIIPRFDDKGLLNLEIGKVKMGALGVTYIAKKMAKKMYSERELNVESDNITALALASVLADKPFEPVFAVEGEKAKVDGVVLEKEVMKIHIIPVGKAANGKKR
jgi:hypothetical protein